MKLYRHVAFVFAILFVAAVGASAATLPENHQYLCVDTGVVKPAFLAASSLGDAPTDAVPGDSQIPGTGIGTIAFACNGGSACTPALSCPASGGPGCAPNLTCACVCLTWQGPEGPQHVAVNKCI